MGKTVETKRKKKGRPSLLDLQKRSLRLQQQQKKRSPNSNANPNPYHRFPNTGACSGLRSTRRNPIIEPMPEVRDDGEDDEETIGKQREKELKLVLRIHDLSEITPRYSEPSGSESEGEDSASRRKMKIQPFGGDGDRSKVVWHSSLKTTGLLRAETPKSGPTTPLPDKKLLLFILDMLQKKDTYGVFSEPVDHEELPDYREVVEHPMDFRTVREKLSRGAYKYLEHFEKDVFLISTNAMRYNSPDTVYYRQARSIQELAKKNFENLRQESDEELETKTVARRGRPPGKSRPTGPRPFELAVSRLSSDLTPANASSGINLPNQTHPLSKKASATDKPRLADVSGKVSYGLRSSDSFGWLNKNKFDAIEEFPGFAKGISARFSCKIAPVTEESRRNTYSQFQPFGYGCEPSIWSLFDCEKQQLAAVGVHMEHAYARSLARFSAHLGSIGWAIASKRIERALPPGTKFGRGWVGDAEAPPPQNPSYATDLRRSNGSLWRAEPSSCSGMLPEASAPCHSNHDGLIMPNTGALNKRMQPAANGFTGSTMFIKPPSSQAGNIMKPVRSPTTNVPELPVSRACENGTPPRNNTLAWSHLSRFNSEMATNCNIPINDSQWQSSLVQAKFESIPPDLNITVDSQQPDLALQL